MFAHKYRFLFIFFLSIYSFTNIVFVGALEAYRIDIPEYYILSTLILMIYFIWEGNRILFFRLNNFKFKNKNTKWVWIFGGSLVLTTISTMIIYYIFYLLFPQYAPKNKFIIVKLMLTFGFRINLFLNTINIIFVYLRELRQAQLEAEEIKKISIQSQLQSLKNQINPHFLFNNLNALSALVGKDPDLAVEFIQQFSKVYRYVLQNQDKELIYLEEELEFLDSYFYLLKTRFNSSLEIKLDISSESKKMYIVSLALQMLIENAIKHNICSKSKPLKIEVYTEGIDKIVVKNNLQIKAVKEESTKIGLNNIIKRYGHISAGKVELIEDKENFIVKLPLIQIYSDQIIIKNESINN